MGRGARREAVSAALPLRGPDGGRARAGCPRRGAQLPSLLETTDPSLVEIRRAVTDAYVDHYLELTDVTREEISRCEPAMAAALLRHQPDNAESETLARMAERGLQAIHRA